MFRIGGLEEGGGVREQQVVDDEDHEPAGRGDRQFSMFPRRASRNAGIRGSASLGSIAFFPRRGWFLIPLRGTIR